MDARISSGDFMPRVAIVAAMTIVGCLASAVSRADICHSPNAPSVFPEPATASDADIVAAQLDVKKYLSDMESSLRCMTATHDDSGYNHAVQDMQRIAATFNGVLRAYRARQQKS
jgi:hypothetical protein